MSVTSPNANQRWMNSSPPPGYDAHSNQSKSTSTSTSTLKPYLQLPHLLSLTWLAYPILSLLFIAFRLELSSASAQDAVSNAKGDLLTSCTAAERAATAAASMPRYMAAATNQQICDAVNDTMEGARAALVLSLTMMEAIIDFMIDIYRSTFLCFLELVIRGGLSILIAAVQDISNVVQGTLSGIRTNIQNDISSANSAIQSALSAINKVNPFGNINVPQFSIPSLSALENVTIPNNFQSALESLNSSLPTFSSLKQDIDAVVNTPFELVKKEINDTFLGLSFNVSVLPVPEQNTLSFCGDLDTSAIDDLGTDLLKVTKIGIVIIVVLALVLLAGNCALEWYKWRCLQAHLQYTREAWTTDPTIYHSPSSSSAPSVELSDHNLMILQASSSHPLLTRIANTLSSKLRLSPSQQTHLHWFLHYIFHPPALACFLIGFFGILSIQLQLLAIGPLEAKYSAQAAASATDFSNTIATSINSSMYNQSSVYASQINGQIDAVQSSINDGLFGWVNGTTSTLNNTLVTFYSELQSGVATVFNGSILEEPIQEFIACFIGSKVDAFEEVLTFLHDNLNVNVPRVNESVLVLSPADVNEATQPIAAAAIGGGTSDNEGLVGRLVNTYVESLKKERIMFGVFLGLWGLVVLMGLAIIFWHSYGRRWVEQYKRRKYLKEQRAGGDGTVLPYTGYEKAKGAETSSQVDLPSFTPMPSPRRGLYPRSEPTTRPAVKNNRSDRGKRRSNHPLSSLHPQFEKSWDSFLDHSAHSDNEHAGRTIKDKGTRKFMGLARKSSDGQDDTNAVVPPGDEDQLENPGWLKRMKGMVWKKRQDDEENSTSDAVSTGSRTRPNLTISTQKAADVPIIETTSPDNDPTSAWSISPGPPRAPWMNAIMPTRKPGNNVAPFQPKSRRNASVPSDVNSTYDSLTIVSSEPHLVKPSPLAFPIHHGFPERSVASDPPAPPTVTSPVYKLEYSFPAPPQSRYRSLAPPLDRHKRNSSVPTQVTNTPEESQFFMPDQRQVSESSTPVTRLLTSTHARQSSQAVDPFVTPFDDEHGLLMSPGLSDKSRERNPFAAVAL